MRLSLQDLCSPRARKWTLQIIAQIGNHKKLRYNELKERLGGISPKSLADRLKELDREGLISRQAFAEIPPRVEYA
ncbi:MAG: winged helix-turn-helix transcriptional regulator, partial [Candidatus Thorarchaeota archaeon]